MTCPGPVSGAGCQTPGIRYKVPGDRVTDIGLAALNIAVIILRSSADRPIAMPGTRESGKQWGCSAVNEGSHIASQRLKSVVPTALFCFLTLAIGDSKSLTQGKVGQHE